MKQCKTNHSSRCQTKPGVICFIVIVIIAILFAIIYLLDKNNIPTALGIVDNNNSKEWLGYGMNMFASLVGFVGAIMAVIITIEKQDERRKDDSRKNVLPLIKIGDYYPTTLDLRRDILDLPIDLTMRDNGESFVNINLSFKNIGWREMYHVYVGGVEYGARVSDKYREIASIIYKEGSYGGSLTTCVICDKNMKEVEISFKVYYSDCYGNWYYQKINGMGNGNSATSYEINDLEIKTAPVLVSREQLPKVIRESVI